MAAEQDPGHGFWSTFSFLTKVRYGGIVGKVTAICIVFFLMLCCVAIFGRGYPLLLAGLALLGFAGLVVVVYRIEAIFKSNPELSSLEGREVITYQQAILKSKNKQALPVIEITADPELPSPARDSLMSLPAEGEDEG